MKNIAIRENHLYKKVYSGGERAAGRYTVVYVLKDRKAYLLKKRSPLKEYVNRIGITVTKKLGCAVKRNRVKRIIRSALDGIFREFEVKKGYLIVVSARDAALDAKSTDIFNEMKRQFARLKMFKDPGSSEKEARERDAGNSESGCGVLPVFSGESPFCSDRGDNAGYGGSVPSEYSGCPLPDMSRKIYEGATDKAETETSGK